MSDFTKVAVLALAILLAACSEPVTEPDPTVIRVGGFQDDGPWEVIPLGSVDDALAWSREHPDVPAAYVSPQSYGVVWSIAGLNCAEHMHGHFQKMDLVGFEHGLEHARPIALALGRHNQKVLSDGHLGDDHACIVDPDWPTS